MKVTSSAAGLRARVSIPQRLALFTRLLNQPGGQPWPTAPSGRPRCYDRRWSPVVTLWYLLWSPLPPDATLDAVVKDARQRRPLRWLRRACTQLTERLREPVSGLAWHGLRVILLDGSTVRVRPHGHLPTRCAPAANQHGRSFWCLIRVVAGFGATGGLALGTGLGTGNRQRTGAGRAVAAAGRRGRHGPGSPPPGPGSPKNR